MDVPAKHNNLVAHLDKMVSELTGGRLVAQAGLCMAEWLIELLTGCLIGVKSVAD